MLSEKIIYRNADLNDSKEITNLSNELGYPSSIEETENRFVEICNSTNHKVIVAANSENKVIGWIHVFGAIRLESEKFAELGGLVVSVEYRGLKIGENLVSKAEDWAKENNYKKIRVRSQVKRIGAHSFYVKLGYPFIKEQKVFEKYF